MSRLLLLALVLVPALVTAQPVSDHVVLVSGDTLRGEVDIREPFLRSAYVSLNDSTRYQFSEVLEVKDGIDYYAVGQGGPFNGTMLVKRVQRGRIDLYEKVTQDAGSWVMGPNGAQTFQPGGQTRHQFFRKGGGGVQPASPSYLRTAMQDDAQALAILDRRERLGYVQWGLVGVGAAVALFGATQSEFGQEGVDAGPYGTVGEKKASLNPLLFVGIGIMAGSWIPSLMREPLLDEAVETYNRGQ